MLGTYSIDKNGDTTLTDYGLYTIKDGDAGLRQGHQGARRLVDPNRPSTGRGRNAPPPAPTARHTDSPLRMEAANIPARRACRRRACDPRVLARYGLIIVLLAMPGRTTASRTSSTTATSSASGQNLKDGISNGAIWALVALGYTLVYGIIELINFAHGDVFMIGSFVSVSLFGDVRPARWPPARSGSSSGCW